MYINKKALKYNINSIQSFIGSLSTFIPVIKADMYGTGIKNILEILESSHCSIVAVAHVSEALQLRFLGYMKSIIVLIQPCLYDLDEIINNNFIISCGDVRFLQFCQKQAALRDWLLKVHIEIDVGMGRTGLCIDDVDLLIKTIKKCPNIVVDGVFTHLPDSSNTSDTKRQIEIFDTVVTRFKNNIGNIQYIHALASSGVFHCYNLSTHYNAVRCGLVMLGYYPSNVNNSLISLKPSISLYTHIVSCKLFPKSAKIGYNRYCLKRTSIMAVIPIGFADILIGYDAPGGYVVINDCKAEVLSICMDTMLIDVTDIKDVKVGDIVYIWENKIVTLNDWEKWCKSSVYEIIALMSSRIDRIIQ